MSNSHTPNQKDRSLQKALTNKIVDEYFSYTESWLRAILRMCFFSIAHLDGQSVLIIECPNQAVAKRLSRKTYPFQGLINCLTDKSGSGDRLLICYHDSTQDTWRCFDTETNSWRTWDNTQIPKFN